jgi:hypothetical protein
MPDALDRGGRTGRQTMTTIRAYHGGSLEGARWYTTDAGHAAIFGDVAEVELESTIDPVHIDAADVCGSESGYAADAMLWAHLEAIDATWAIVAGWEGSGECIVVREPHYVRVTEV